MYVITEWLERYEVNEKGQPAKPGDKLRNRPLEYIRSKVHGRSQGAGFLAMQMLAGDRDYEVFGLFQKFLEIAACEKGEKRGALLNHRGRPATVEEVATICRKPLDRVQFAIEILTNPTVGWMEEVPFQKFLEILESGKIDKESATNNTGAGLPKLTNGDIDTENRVKLQKNLESVNMGNKNDHSPENSGVLYKAPGRLYNENETKRERNETELNETTRARARAREGQTSDDPPADATSDSAIARASSSSASSRLGFGNKLRELLGPKTKEDLTALWNLQHWADQQGETSSAAILQIAEESKTGRKPLAVFFSRVKEELGYRPRAERDKQHA